MRRPAVQYDMQFLRDLSPKLSEEVIHSQIHSGRLRMIELYKEWQFYPCAFRCALCVLPDRLCPTSKAGRRLGRGEIICSREQRPLWRKE